jgi:4-aminobutyrate aminotransferase-like enzyme
VRFIPPLVVQSEHVNEAASIWIDSVAAVTG